MALNVSPLARSLLRFILNVYKWCVIRYQQIKVYWNQRKTKIAVSTKNDAETRLANGQAWDEFCDTLKAAGAIVFAPGAPQNDLLTQAEGYRYLSRLTRAGLENFVECANVEAPQLCAIANGSRAARICIGSDNPDNLYENATIDGSMEYVVKGTRGTVPYLSFGTQTGSYGTKGGLATVDLMDANQLVYDEDSHGKKRMDSDVGRYKTFTIYVSEKRPPHQFKNWLRLKSQPTTEALFIVRQTFGNRTREIPAKLSIHRIQRQHDDSDDGSYLTTDINNIEQRQQPPSILTPEKLDQGLQQAGIFVAGASAMFTKWSWEFKSKHTNQLPLFNVERSNQAGGDPNIRYYHSYWDLNLKEMEKDHDTNNNDNNNDAEVVGVTRRKIQHVLRIKFTPPPKCELWNFQLNNHWMESLDYRYHTIHTNSTLAKPDNDVVDGNGGVTTSKPQQNSYTIIVSEQNPNYDGNFRGNWIETVGHTCGTMCFRYVNPHVSNDDDLPHPNVEVMTFDDLFSSNNVDGKS